MTSNKTSPIMEVKMILYHTWTADDDHGNTNISGTDYIKVHIIKKIPTYFIFD